MDVWPRCLERLEAELPAEDVHTWLKPLQAGSREGGFVLAPNADPAGSITASTAAHHGDFDDDPATVKSTLARMLGAAAQGPAKGLADPGIEFHRSASRMRERRAVLDDASLRRG